LRQLRKSITAVQGAGASTLRRESQHMPPRTMLPPRMRLPKKSGSRRRSIYLPLWNGDHRDIASRSSFAFEEQLPDRPAWPGFSVEPRAVGRSLRGMPLWPPASSPGWRHFKSGLEIVLCLKKLGRPFSLEALNSQFWTARRQSAYGYTRAQVR